MVHQQSPLPLYLPDLTGNWTYSLKILLEIGMKNPANGQPILLAEIAEQNTTEGLGDNHKYIPRIAYILRVLLLFNAGPLHPYHSGQVHWQWAITNCQSVSEETLTIMDK